MGDRVVLRSGGGRYLEVTRQPDGSLRIHGHDIGSDVAAIFGSSDYEWYKTIAVADLSTFRQVFGVPNGVDEIDHLQDHYCHDRGAAFERLVRDHELASGFWSWP